MVIWDVPIFCRFYGRVIPYNSKESKFNEFTASKMEEDVDTHITFDKSLEPMTFISILALSRSLFVVGYGKVKGLQRIHIRSIGLFIANVTRH